MPKMLRVLVGDPNRDLVATTAQLLRCWGHDVRVALDGPTVLDVARWYQPEVVLMDLCLPGLDGYQVAQRLRQQEGLANVLLAAVTGYGTEPYRRRGREAGFDYHLLKPVDPEMLRQLLEARARSTASARAARAVAAAPRSRNNSLPSLGRTLLTVA